VTGNDSKTRPYLLEKDPKTAKEALTLAISFQAAHSYNEAVKDKTETLTVSNSDFDSKAGNGRMRDRRRDDVHARHDDYDNKQYRYKDRDRDNNRERYGDTSQDWYRNSSRDRYRDSSRERYRDSSRDRYRHNSRDRYSDSNRERQRDNYRGQRGNDYRDRDNNNKRDRNNYGNNSRDRSQERYNSFSSRECYNNRRHDPGHGHRGAYRFNNVDRRGNGFTGQRGGFGNRRLDTRELANNHVDDRSALQYVMAIFNEVEVPMLVDTGSAITLISENYGECSKLTSHSNQYPFAVSSVNNHQIDILGQKVIRFSLKSKARYRAPCFFYFNVFVARNLSKEAIIGIDFLRRFQAKIDTCGEKLTLIKDGVLSAHNLFERIGTASVAVSSTFLKKFSKEHISTHTLDMIGIDIIGPLPTSNRKIRFINNMADFYNNKTRDHNVNFSTIPLNNNKLQEQWVHQNQLTRQRVTATAHASKPPTATLPSVSFANVTMIPLTNNIQPKDEPVFQPMRQRQATAHHARFKSPIPITSKSTRKKHVRFASSNVSDKPYQPRGRIDDLPTPIVGKFGLPHKQPRPILLAGVALPRTTRTWGGYKTHPP
jgi:hypothetical protein